MVTWALGLCGVLHRTYDTKDSIYWSKNFGDGKILQRCHVNVSLQPKVVTSKLFQVVCHYTTIMCCSATMHIYPTQLEPHGHQLLRFSAQPAKKLGKEGDTVKSSMSIETCMAKSYIRKVEKLTESTFRPKLLAKLGSTI